MTKDCPICNSSDTSTIAPFRYENPIFSGCSLTKCQSCSMVFASPMPSEEMLFRYNANYFTAAHGGPPTNSLSVAFFSGIAKIRHAFVLAFIDKHKITVRNVLEVGPGAGFFARSWLRHAPDDTYSAVETDETCHQFLKTLGVQIVSLADARSADLIVMSHVLEHVPDPVGFVQAATRGLQSGGVLFIEVPCRDWEHKNLEEPHILFFDKAPMLRLLGDLGFADIEVGYYGQPISELKSVTRLQKLYSRVRAKLISWGFVMPFAFTSAGMNRSVDPLERAMVKPTKAHQVTVEPAWWLRAIARKK